jgi:hypothetical protein
MKKATSKRPKKASRPTPRRAPKDEMRAEYDFSGAMRGKYAARYAQGTNLVLLEPDVAAEFSDAKAVNRALRAYLKERAKRRTA